VGVSSRAEVNGHGENKKKGSSVAFFRFFFSLFLESKLRPKNQKMNPQKQYLEVSNSIREEVRAIFRFTAKQKN
jgi:hypothetical protein